jgi:hypothetical protein
MTYGTAACPATNQYLMDFIGVFLNEPPAAKERWPEIMGRLAFSNFAV